MDVPTLAPIYINPRGPRTITENIHWAIEGPDFGLVPRIPKPAPMLMSSASGMQRGICADSMLLSSISSVTV